MTIALRQTVHRGHVVAVGVILDVEHVDRVFDVFVVGTQLLRLRDGRVFVRWPTSRRLHVDDAVGLVVVEVAAGVCSTAPLTRREREALHLARGDLVVVVGGVAVVCAVASLGAVDVAALVDVEAFVVVVPRVLPPPAPIARPVEPATTATLFQDLSGGSAAAQAAALQPLGAGDRVRRAVGAVAGRVAGWLAAASATPSSSPKATSSHSKTTKQTRTTTTKPPAWLTTLQAALAKLAAWATGNRHQREYLASLLALFDEGRLDEALRRAIPLGGKTTDDARPALGTPDARTSLEIRSFDGGASRVIDMGDDVTAQLRQRYRDSVTRLKREGRAREAAFVLIELLHALDEGVSLLEQHGEARLAAEIAEARELSPALIVRLWFVAGDVDRAVDVARHRGCFPHAIQRLQRDRADDARTLRGAWADGLVGAGCLDEAIEVVWPDDVLQPRALPWIEQALRADDANSGWLATRLLLLAPHRFDEVKAIVLATLDDDDSDEAIAGRRRLAFGLQDADTRCLPARRELARLTIRRLVLDAARDMNPRASTNLTKLAQFADDGPLRLDVAALPEPPKPTSPRPELRDVVLDDPFGHFEIVDVALLHKGRFALALGDAGVHVVNRQGKTQCRLREPTERFVLNDSFDHALGLVRVGGAMRVSRLGFSAQKAEPWCDVDVGVFADTFDGALWFVGMHDSVVALDVLGERPRAIWRAKDLGAAPIAVARDRASLSTVVVDEHFRWHLPSLSLQQRRPAVHAPHRLLAVAPDDAHTVTVGIGVDDAPARVLHDRIGELKLIATTHRDDATIAASNMHVAVAVAVGDDVVVEVYDHGGAHVWRAVLVSAEWATLRLQGRYLAIGDDRGRAWAVDLTTLTVVSRGRALA